mmetsp:Transcript_36030/g.36714  ORF Transcript_36030/g.36714 Transcript_36030/m.36714 type:complete len:326 (+) Transcript_36030:83-1060(+)|eukprot:CAMPEP_0182428876 /NCGR_PEP_ID=MMETSP1167-20130531/24332_1 /TAXON_ID=2988 /ORGANISM="Mallomonas Sp, Strain CCMP3275" /LENGTH=325 /DNA_ID=CAMNT_0024612059 /DNA_START=70 /DNA_END=1047 /DNA_ORIENTATION=+
MNNCVSIPDASHDMSIMLSRSCSENTTENEIENEHEEIIDNPLWRKGKWTIEEEEYAKKLVTAFRMGCLSCPSKVEGRTLRSYLSKRLNCNPMRISKKFAGLEGLGGRFIPRDGVTPEHIEYYQKELSEYETRFLAKDAEMVNRRKKRRRRTVSRQPSADSICSTTSSACNSAASSACSSAASSICGDDQDDEDGLDFLCDFDDFFKNKRHNVLHNEALTCNCDSYNSINSENDKIHSTVSEDWSTESDTDTTVSEAQAQSYDVMQPLVTQLLTWNSFDSLDLDELALDDLNGQDEPLKRDKSSEKADSCFLYTDEDIKSFQNNE